MKKTLSMTIKQNSRMNVLGRVPKHPTVVQRHIKYYFDEKYKCWKTSWGDTFFTDVSALEPWNKLQ
jgi:hypothetical protein